MAYTLNSRRRAPARFTALMLAVAAALLAALMLLPSVALAQAPSGVGTITVTRGDGTLTASWGAVSGATKYHVTYTTDGGASWHAPVDDNSNYPSNSITFSADNAKTYIIGARAGNADGWSGWRNSSAAGPYSPPNNPVVNPPGGVGTITVTRGDGTLTASWNAVSGATKYHITYSSDHKQSWAAPSCGDNCAGSSVTIDNADNSKTYYIGARAGNSAGWSGWKNSAAAGPFTPEPTPTPTPEPTATPTPTPTPGIIVQDSDGNAITALAVPEGGEASYQVKLASPIAQDAKVCIGLAVRDNNDPDITFKGEASGVVAVNLTFTPDNWDTAQTVTLVAAEDDDAVNGARDIDHDSREWYFSGKVDLAVTEADND